MTRRPRNVSVENDSQWVFNRMADDYDARPAYPLALIDEIAKHASISGSRVLDIGAGIGHIALPLAERGFDVLAIEPARQMLDRLRSEASRRCIELRTKHGAAEHLPFESSSFDCAVISDALHFLDVNRTVHELRRVLAPRASLVIVTCGFEPTPFMLEIQKCITQLADRRPRNVCPAIRSLATLGDFLLSESKIIRDETELDEASLERVLRTVSFVGPAMAGARFEILKERISRISQPRVWARRFTIRLGRCHLKPSVALTSER